MLKNEDIKKTKLRVFALTGGFMKKIVSVLLALIMCSTFVVSASAIIYEGAGDIEFDSGFDLITYDGSYEDLGNAYWYEWELDAESVGYGEIEFTIYYDAFDWQEEQYCEGPEDYPAMLDYLRESYQDYGTVTDCTIDGYPAIIIENNDYSESSDSGADIFICGDVYFYEVQLLFIEDIMTYDCLLAEVKKMELNAEPGVQFSDDHAQNDENEEIAENEEIVEGNDNGFSKTAIIIAVVIGFIICFAIAVIGVVAIVIVRKKK